MALLECGGGLDRYLDAHRHLRRDGANGAVVINGNPFTRGHQYLVETAAAQVDTLYVFIVREDRSVFPFAVRQRLAAESVAHVTNAVLLDTSRYAVSAATFPSYFLRQHDEKARLQMEIDVRLFGAHLAPAFGITRRFVGHEPYCETTAAYNRTMAAVLPCYGIEFVEVRRRQTATVSSARHRVRDALARGDRETLARLVPPPTLAFFDTAEGAPSPRASAGGRRAQRGIPCDSVTGRKPRAESRKPFSYDHYQVRHRRDHAVERRGRPGRARRTRSRSGSTRP